MKEFTLHIMVGLPRSGKSTYARELSEKLNAPIVSPDNIRLALHGQVYYTPAEPFVWAIAKTMTKSLFLSGHENVILDATNIMKSVRDEWKNELWYREFHEIHLDSKLCKERAIATNQEYLLTVIDRMISDYEPITDEEREQ